MELRERLLSNIEVNTTNGCWEWQGRNNGAGYGKIGDKLAHRLSFAEFCGPIPDGMLVCHRCDNPPCINPEHLFLGTNEDNLRDCREKKRNNFGARNGSAKLTDGQVVEIINLRRSGRTIKEIGDTYGVRERSNPMAAEAIDQLVPRPSE